MPRAKTAWWNTPLNGWWVLARLGVGILVLIAARVSHWLAIALIVLVFIFAVAFRFAKKKKPSIASKF